MKHHSNSTEPKANVASFEQDPFGPHLGGDSCETEVVFCTWMARKRFVTQFLWPSFFKNVFSLMLSGVTGHWLVFIDADVVLSGLYKYQPAIFKHFL